MHKGAYKNIVMLSKSWIGNR